MEDNKKAKEEFHLGFLIEQKYRSSGLSAQEFADGVCRSKSTVYDFFKRPSFNNEQLELIGKVLNYDFLNAGRNEQNVPCQEGHKVFILIEVDGEIVQRTDLSAYFTQLVEKEKRE